MARNIETRIAELETATPRGYTTYDGKGRPVIQSALPVRDWLRWAMNTLNGRRSAARTALLEQLARSERAADGSLIHEYLHSVYEPLEDRR
jgi:hypothetical protein